MQLVLANIAIVLIIMAGSSRGVESNIVLMPEARFETPSKVENYILQHQRQFEDHIRGMDRDLNDVRSKYEMRLEVIQFYSTVVDVKLDDLQDRFDPMEMLGGIHDYCVQKYRAKIPAEGVMQETLKTCISKAKQSFVPLLNSAENTLRNIKNHFNNQFINSMKECKKRHEKNETKYHSCAAEGIKKTSTFFTSNTNIFLSQMTIAECSANTKIDEAFDCYSTNVYQTFTSIGEVTGLIENCVAGHEVCPPCANEDPNSIKGRCPYQMAWHLADDDLTGEKIVNPFKGVNNTTPCLQINFIIKDLDIEKVALV
ncbi:uncharacterized protein LOC106093045 isoform X1 [Stomoxys calcitrans]|uniref:uncharacterized protein LOC106093045 isoform X1 n=2 Tax=Stomoxys calcitrans TaxID=35570 RepID=UPI0027E3884C|nr:uncharacterized protein LOC106093045 isoform X1 [Stomoxys calcitrans]